MLLRRGRGSVVLGAQPCAVRGQHDVVLAAAAAGCFLESFMERSLRRSCGAAVFRCQPCAVRRQHDVVLAGAAAAGAGRLLRVLLHTLGLLHHRRLGLRLEVRAWRPRALRAQKTENDTSRS